MSDQEFNAIFIGTTAFVLSLIALYTAINTSEDIKNAIRKLNNVPKVPEGQGKDAPLPDISRITDIKLHPLAASIHITYENSLSTSYKIRISYEAAHEQGIINLHKLNELVPDI